MKYASRAGEKLEYALEQLNIDVSGLVCADFGASTGGFVDCLLQHGAGRVYAVETGYGVLDWNLRNNPLVVVMERTNAMHVDLPERVDFISIDTSWTKLKNIVPNALKNLKTSGQLVVLVKPHYEADQNMLEKGRLPDELIPQVLDKVKNELQSLGQDVLGEVESPIQGTKGKNREFLFYLSSIE
jgi:23S rRNA (cytidine1920-2'-O)/16S rRNA (cytidine1409-2'-O)-methyltransferase